MFAGKNILAIGAHPDDIEYGVFGTLDKFRQSINLFCYVATEGGDCDSTSGRFRVGESKSILETMLSPQASFWGHRVGIDYMEYGELVHEIEIMVDFHKINLVLAPTKADTHQDHRLISDITVSALRRSNATLLFYPTLGTITADGFESRIFVDITANYDRKKEALSLLYSQADKLYMQERYLDVFNVDFLASLHGLSYVERFDVGWCFI